MLDFRVYPIVQHRGQGRDDSGFVKSDRLLVITKTPNRKRFFIFGDLNVDEIVNHGSESVRRGVYYVEPERRLGGTAYNAATCLTEHDYDVVLYGRIGKDSDGDFVKQELEQTNLTAILFESERPTGKANLHYFGEDSPERLLFHTDNSANNDYVIKDVGDTLDFYQADAHDFIFLPCHIFQRERDPKKLRCFFDELKSHHSRLILDLVPHELWKFVSPKDFLDLVADHTHLVVTEMKTITTLLGIQDASEEPTEPVIREIFKTLPASVLLLRFGVSNISRQWIVKKIPHSYEILEKMDDTGFMRDHHLRRGFGDRLMAEAFQRYAAAIF